MSNETMPSKLQMFKQVRQWTGRGAWGGGPLAPRAPLQPPRTLFRSQRTRSNVYVLPQYSESMLSMGCYR